MLWRVAPQDNRLTVYCDISILNGDKKFSWMVTAAFASEKQVT